MRYENDPLPWEVRSSRYISNEAPWWTLREDHVVLPSGAEIERWWVSEYPTWCNVVAITGDEEIVLVRQYRHGVKAVHFELPGGVADHGTAEESARMELLEETGFGAGSWSPLMTLCANSALSNNYTHSFLALGVEHIAEPTHETTEDLRIYLMKSSQVLDLIDNGEIVQALHVAPLLRYLIGR
ncbi:MAG: NUDIX hydrolase [Actinomycetota bacterium]